MNRQTLLRAWWRPTLAAIWLLAVANLTLRPLWEPLRAVSRTPEICLICGTGGMADALQNVLLFLPLGFLLGSRPSPVVRGVATGLVISLAIEASQTFLPGRYPSLADLVWNSVGAGMGTFLYLQLERILRRGGWSPAGTLALAAAGVAALMLAGWAETPVPGSREYWGHWTPQLGGFPTYEGNVLHAVIEGRTLEHGRLDRETKATIDGQDWSIDAQVVLSDPPRGVSPVVYVTDDREEEIVLLGAHRDALVFSQRRMANRLRLDTPDVRLTDAFVGYSAGDTVSIGASRSDGSLCLRVDERRECGMGITAGRTWGFLLYVAAPREWFRHLVDVVWVMAMGFLIGVSARSWRNAAGGGLALGLGMIGVAILTPLVPGPWFEYAAAIGGAILGRWTLGIIRAVATIDPAVSRHMSPKV